MSKRWLTQYINKMWSRGLGLIPSCQQRSPHNVLHSQCLDASCQRLHPVGIEPVTSCHASLTRLHILLMYWVNHLLDILAPGCPKGDWPNTLTASPRPRVRKRLLISCFACCTSASCFAATSIYHPQILAPRCCCASQTGLHRSADAAVYPRTPTRTCCSSTCHAREACSRP